MNKYKKIIKTHLEKTKHIELKPTQLRTLINLKQHIDPKVLISYINNSYNDDKIIEKKFKKINNDNDLPDETINEEEENNYKIELDVPNDALTFYKGRTIYLIKEKYYENFFYTTGEYVSDTWEPKYNNVLTIVVEKINLTLLEKVLNQLFLIYTPANIKHIYNSFFSGEDYITKIQINTPIKPNLIFINFINKLFYEKKETELKNKDVKIKNKIPIAENVEYLNINGLLKFITDVIIDMYKKKDYFYIKIISTAFYIAFTRITDLLNSVKFKKKYPSYAFHIRLESLPTLIHVNPFLQ